MNAFLVFFKNIVLAVCQFAADKHLSNYKKGLSENNTICRFISFITALKISEKPK